MNAKLAMQENSELPVLLPINAVERETGVTKELLRMWERRYNFPAPQRDAQGDRVYPVDQVAKLRLVRRLIDAGYRPSKLMSLSSDDLEHMLKSQTQARHEVSPEFETELLAVIKTSNSNEIQDYLAHQMVTMGLERFVLDFLQHANGLIAGLVVSLKFMKNIYLWSWCKKSCAKPLLIYVQ